MLKYLRYSVTGLLEQEDHMEEVVPLHNRYQKIPARKKRRVEISFQSKRRAT